MLRRIADLIVRLAMRTFYRRIDVAGLENVPTKGPILFVANHWNSLVDPLIIQAAVPRWVTFAAAEFLFHGALGWFMRHLGMIPIYRASDQHDPKANLDSFRRCFEVFDAGGTMAIFPEGVSHDNPNVLKIKSGAARIFFGAEERHQGKLGLTVIPVGLVYEGKDKFQSRVTVVLGKPLETAPLLDIAREKPQRAIRQMTNAMQSAMEEVTFSEESWREHRLVGRAVEFWQSAHSEIAPGTPPISTPDEEVALRLRIRARLADLRANHPQRLHQLRLQLATYVHILDRLGITDRHVREDHSLGRTLRFLLRGTELMLFGWPLAAWGIANNLPSFLIVRYFLPQATQPRRDRLSTMKIYPGVPVYLGASLLQSVGIGTLALMIGWPWWIGLIYLASLPCSGWYAIDFLWRRRETHQSIRAWALLAGQRGLRRALRVRRTRLIALIRDTIAEC